MTFGLVPKVLDSINMIDPIGKQLAMINSEMIEKTYPAYYKQTNSGNLPEKRMDLKVEFSHKEAGEFYDEKVKI